MSPVRSLAIFALYMLLIDTIAPLAGDKMKMLDECFVPLVVIATVVTRRGVILGRVSRVRDGAVAVLLLAALASSLLNAVPLAVWVPGMLLLLKGMGLFYVVLLHDVTRADARWISVLVLGFGIAVLAVGLVELVAPGLVRGPVPGVVSPDRAGVPQVRSVFYHPQLFGWLCALIALYLFAHYIVMGRRWMLVLALLFSAGTILSARRRSILALGVGLGIGVVADVARRPRGRSPRLKRSLISAASVFVLAAAFLPTFSVLYAITADSFGLPLASPTAVPSPTAAPSPTAVPRAPCPRLCPRRLQRRSRSVAPAPEPTGMSLTNPGFETGDLVGWGAFDASGGRGVNDGTVSVEQVSTSSTPVGTGSYQGVLMRNAFGGAGPRIYSTPFTVAAGDYVDVSAILGGDGVATLGVQWRTESGGYISQTYGTDLPSLTGARSRAVLGPAPVDARWAAAIVRNHAAAGTTRVVVDDVTVAPAPEPSGMSLTNPGFETGDLVGWGAYDASGCRGVNDGTVSVEQVSTSSTPVGTGSYQGVLLRNAFGGSGPRIYSTPFTVTAGDYVDVSAILGGDGVGTLGVQWRTESGDYISQSYGTDLPSPAGARYSAVLGPAPVDARWAAAIVRNHATAGTTSVVVDDVTVAPAPEPSGMSLTNPGFETGDLVGWGAYDASGGRGVNDGTVSVERVSTSSTPVGTGSYQGVLRAMPSAGQGRASTPRRSRSRPGTTWTCLPSSAGTGWRRSASSGGPSRGATSARPTAPTSRRPPVPGTRAVLGPAPVDARWAAAIVRNHATAGTTSVVVDDVTVAPAPEPSGMSLTNPGFETGDLVGWGAYDASGGRGVNDGTVSVERVSTSSTPVGTGSYQGVLLRNAFGGSGPRIYSTPFTVTAGDYVDVSAILGGDGVATLGVQWRTESGDYISQSYGTDLPSPAGARYSAVLGPAPADARWAAAIVRNHATAGTTSVVVDDVTVAPGAPSGGTCRPPASPVGPDPEARKEQRDTPPRLALYWGSVLVARDYFPLGAGLGRYGSWMSRIVYSDLYVQYGLDKIWGLGPTQPKFITDTFWPQILGETGVIGLLAYLVFLATIGLRLWRLAMRKDLPVEMAAIVLGTTMMFGEALVETVASAIFNSPSQIYLVMLLVAGTLSLVAMFDARSGTPDSGTDAVGAA